MKKIGFDLVDISRFKEYKKKDHAFLKKVFTDQEIEYCFNYKDPAPHLAGMFAAKEAVSKALGVTKYPFIEIEIRHMKDGKPVAYRNNKKLLIEVSITHTDHIAGAIALV